MCYTHVESKIANIVGSRTKERQRSENVLTTMATDTVKDCARRRGSVLWGTITTKHANSPAPSGPGVTAAAAYNQPPRGHLRRGSYVVRGQGPAYAGEACRDSIHR